MSVSNLTQVNETFTGTSPIPLYTKITLWSILLIWSLLGNVLAIAVVYCNQNLRTNVNYLIVNMAVSDLPVPLVVVPLWYISSYTTDGEWLVDGPLGEALCKLFPFLSHISPFVSSISLVIIAFQRFMAVVYPTRRQVLSRKTRWVAISFPWIVAMALCSPYFYIYHLTNKRGYTRCVYSWSPAFDSLKAQTIFLSMKTMVGFVLPLIVIIILYTMIIYKLRQSLNNVMDMIEKKMIRSRQRRNKRIFSLLITIVVMFSIFWCPVVALAMLNLIAPLLLKSADTIHKLYFAFNYMPYLLAAINPCIYFVFLRDFRQGLKTLCCTKTTRRPGTSRGESNQDPTNKKRLPLGEKGNIQKTRC